jgi:hypothetical protein
MDTYDLDIYKGQTFALSITVRDQSGIPLNLAGTQISGYLKTRYSDTGMLSNLNASILDAANGVVGLSIGHTGTANLPVGYGFYDVEMMTPDGLTIVKILAGKASIYPEATF